MEHIGEIEKKLWGSADTLRANSNFASNEYFIPVMGLIFLRHAYSRFQTARDEIKPTLPIRQGKPRPLKKEDFSARSAIFLRPEAQFEYLVSLPEGKSTARALIHAMESIEDDYESLEGTLPKQEYEELDDGVLRQVLRIFADPALKKADGDVFGRIYEYFLTQFADEKAHDGGEFFTPPSIVQTIVNVIEPKQGKIIDPACGSGGMFVQSAHFIENMKANPNERVTFYGMEKNPTTLRLAKMNLAVHGLEGNIQKAISYYEDPHADQGPFDFVMANPPFNVDEIDAEKVKDDKRLFFGLPGVNNSGKVSNGNYIWISFFHSYLSDTGRAGVVMSSQASSAGGKEADMRKAMVKSGDVDIMIAIRSNFFYTRTVPCELWFFDRNKPQHLKDKVLMLDARQIFRKVTRAVCDFSPEQMKNLSSIVWLYRGREDHFAELVRDYLSTARSQALSANFDELFKTFDVALTYFKEHVDVADLETAQAKLKEVVQDFSTSEKNLSEPELDIVVLTAALAEITKVADIAKTLVKDIDQITKLLAKAQEAVVATGEKAFESKKHLKAIDEARKALTGDPNSQLTVTGALKRLCYFADQSDWLLSRFPEGKLIDVQGLVKLVNHDELSAHDYSLTPGRYVGVAPEVEDENFDFDHAIKAIHEELSALNDEAARLADIIAKNFDELVV
ncbi:MAG: N-6 DNA methylase [Gammaproteobacteria bacterium]|nr:N-6 DNA methylase [Gammaproteobacteria bacterium]